ncbi:MAG: hypothetical protein DRR06_16405 [Gammaproteobacteria bacterium]|nr:MAG: hypothetical protein DRR06_16405 [Gammaproteobacteria bacterium]
MLPIILQLELTQSKYSAALETYDVMKKFPNLMEENRQLVTAVTELHEQIQSGVSLSVRGEITEFPGRKNAWGYKPLRRKLAFYDVSGELDEFDLRCDWKRFRDDASKKFLGKFLRVGVGVICMCMEKLARHSV